MLWEFDIKYVVILAWFFDLFGFIAILMDKKLSKFQLFLHFLDKVLNVSIKVIGFQFNKLDFSSYLFRNLMLHCLILCSFGIIIYSIFNFIEFSSYKESS